MTDSAASYFAALSAIRLMVLLSAERWPEPEETFDLVLAVALSKLARFRGQAV